MKLFDDITPSKFNDCQWKFQVNINNYLKFLKYKLDLGSRQGNWRQSQQDLISMG